MRAHPVETITITRIPVVIVAVVMPIIVMDVLPIAWDVKNRSVAIVPNRLARIADVRFAVLIVELSARNVIG